MSVLGRGGLSRREYSRYSTRSMNNSFCLIALGFEQAFGVPHRLLDEFVRHLLHVVALVGRRLV